MAITLPPVDFEKALNSAIAVAASATARDPRTDLAPKDVPAVVEVAKEMVKPVIADAQARYDYATNNESLPTSWSFNSAWIAVLSSGLTIYGALADGYVAADDNVILIGSGGMLISAAGWLIGRFRGKPIGS